MGNRILRRLLVSAASIVCSLPISSAIAQNPAARPAGDAAGNDDGIARLAPPREQSVAAPAAKAVNRSDRTPDGELSPRPGEPIRIRTRDGQSQWELYGTTFEEYLEFLRTRYSAGRNDPEFSISSIALEGTGDDDRATLTARFEIQVDRDGIWLPVSIGMQEASLLPGLRHTGAGEFRAVAAVSRASGHTVYVRGKGLHVLTIPFVVPIRRQLNQRHLQLTIPPAAGSQITLLVRRERCEVKPIDGAQVHPFAVPKGTRIEAVGIRGQFDLVWETPLDEPQARTVFDVFTKCTLGTDGDRLQLKVFQTIDSKQGNLASARVRMPPGFRAIAGQQLYVAEPRKYGAGDIDSAGLIKVDLKPVVGTRIELRWELSAPPSGGLFVLRGFDVEGARSESGEVSISPTEGFHFDYRGGSNVRRINVSAVGGGLAECAYSFSQPFRLDLTLDEIRPQFSADSALFLLLSEQRAELTGQFRVKVRQGAVGEMVWQWPDWKKQGWTIEQAPEGAEIAEDPPQHPAAAGTLRFRLNGRRGNEFVLNFRAARAIPPHAASFPMTLPVAVGSLRAGGTLIVADAENVKSELKPLADTVARPIGPSRHDLPSAPESFRDLRQVAWRVDSAVEAFDASVIVQKQVIETESTARIEVKPGRLQVKQRIAYRVSYERLAEASFILPKELKSANVRFYLEKSDLAPEVDTNWSTVDSDSGEQGRITFSESRIGPFDIYAKYSVPLVEHSANETSTDVSVPLVRSRDAAFKTIRVELCAQDDLEAEVVDEAWSPQIPVPDMTGDKVSTHAWSAPGDRTAIPLRLLRTAGGALPAVKITRALLRSMMDMAGTVQTTAQYRLEKPAASLVIVLPPGATDPRFWLDDIEVKPERIREARPAGGDFHLDIGSLSANPRPVLTAEYREAHGSPFELISVHHLSAPTFPDKTSVGAMMWEVTFPYDHYLFLNSAGFSPEFRWRRDSLLWSRRPTHQAAELASWLGSGARAATGDGNAYAFSRFGTAPTIVVGSMAQSSVILIGAGLSLIMAFCLLNLPKARTPLFLFAVAIAFVVASLWFAEAVRLLLQPALLGCVLAVAAALLDGRIQRRRAQFMIAAPSAADFVATASSPSSIERAMVYSVDPEAPTINRPATENSGPPPVSSFELRGEG